MQIIYRFARQYYIPILIVLVTKLIILFIVPTIALNIFSIDQVHYLNLLDVWNIRDAPHYQSIAEDGYQKIGLEASYIAFLPFYPSTIRLLSYLLNINSLYSSFLISTVASFLLAVILYKLILLDYSKKIAFNTILLLFIFPSAFFLHIPYNEALFLLLVVLAFYLIRKHFLLGLVIVSLATATRIQGLALIPASYVELMKFKKEILKQPFFLLISIILPFLGFACYLFINYQMYGNWLYFQKVQGYFWQNNFSILGGIPRAASYITNLKEYRLVDGFEQFALGYSQLFAFTLFLIIIIYGYGKIRRSYFIYMLLVLVLSYPADFWRSMPRFVLVAFPVFLVMSFIVDKNKLLRYLIYVVFAGLWLIYSAIALADYSIS